MKIVCISDTHTYQRAMKHSIPEGDVLVHAGDFMNSGHNKRDYLDFIKWFNDQPHLYKVFIAGNHDRFVEKYNEEFRSDVKDLNNENLFYLQDESCVIEGIKFYGSPWQKWFWDWAFNFPNPHWGEPTFSKPKAELAAKECWAKIPLDTNVLITHGQPYGLNDRAPDGELTGCPHLLNKINELKDLKLYVGGHIHCEYGTTVRNKVHFVNASVCTERYVPTNAPIVFDLV